MKLLKEIYHNRNLKIEGNIFHREAVRGIILKNKKILMIYSNENGDIKFPGGGVKERETHEEALIREIKEEAGAMVLEIGKGIGKVIEYKKDRKNIYDIFKMTSYYYLCKVQDNCYQQELDEYEEELGFEPVWINIDDAVRKNKKVLGLSPKKIPRWTERETLVLEYLRGII